MVKKVEGHGKRREETFGTRSHKKGGRRTVSCLHRGVRGTTLRISVRSTTVTSVVETVGVTVDGV